MKLYPILALLGLCAIPAQAKKVVFSHPHGFYEAPFYVTLSDTAHQMSEGATIRYTLDGSEPTAQSTLYTQPLYITGNTILRTAIVQGDSLLNSVATATYLFMDDVLNQGDSPKGYPAKWGKFTTISGEAPADYGMDPEMTRDATLAPKIREGFKSLPILSIVTDKDNLFSHVNDAEKGGIYIFTGPPVGDDTGHGWTRQAHIELFGQGHDLSANCGLRLHGGHGRLAEKNPKHSFRLVFKKEYGKKTLEYPIYGEDEPDKFDQLVLRCHFGNAWQHWSTGNHQKAQYTRDVWARRMQREMGWTAANALYVHLFLNGMYWGMYNIAERIDAQYGKNHFDCKKDSIDVIKVEESGGNHLEAAEGDMEAWNLMVQTCRRAASDEAYYRLQGLNADGEEDASLEALLDIDAFIDYMLINQYGGNGDWDHHNWYAIRQRGPESEGYRFICWDSELIHEDVNANILSKNNGQSYPTGMFQSLIQNRQFAIRYRKRAKQLLADDGMLGPKHAEALWDSLYHVISMALYDEAARWGDYRRDVHPWQTKGQLYTVDGTYMAERRRLHEQYFPYRSERALNHILSFVNVDDFEKPADWVALSQSMFHRWNGTGANAQPLDVAVTPDWNMGVTAGGGTAVAGFVNVDHDLYADITEYEQLVIRGSGNGLRILTNRLEAHGDYKEIEVSFNSSDPYWNSELQAIVVPLSQIKNMRTKNGANRYDSFVHLCTLKVNWNNSANVSGVYLILPEEKMGIDQMAEHTAASHDGLYRNLSGQVVAQPHQGIYLCNGRKVIVSK